MSTRVLHAVTALLWLQGQNQPASTLDVEAVLMADRRTALRVLRALDAIGVIRCLRTRRHSTGQRGHQGLLWEAVDIDEALDAALAGCRGDA